MWIIHLLPDAWLLHVCHALIALGLLGFAVASFGRAVVAAGHLVKQQTLKQTIKRLIK